MSPMELLPAPVRQLPQQYFTSSSSRPVLQRTISNDTNSSSGSDFSSVSQSKYRFLTPQYNDRINDLSAQYKGKLNTMSS